MTEEQRYTMMVEQCMRQFAARCETSLGAEGWLSDHHDGGLTLAGESVAVTLRTQDDAELGRWLRGQVAFLMRIAARCETERHPEDWEDDFSEGKP